MDCRTALQLLDVLRPGEDDAWTAELSAATAHVESCRPCALKLRKRRGFDRRIGQAMHDVSIPVGLESRLLRALAAVPAESSATSSPAMGEPATTFDATSTMTAPGPDAAARPEKSLSRRAWFRYAGAACVAISAVGAWWMYGVLTAPRMTVGGLLEELMTIQSESWQTLPVFHGDEALQTLPDGGWQTDLVRFRDPPRGLPLVASRHTIALYSFAADLGHGERVRGVLLVTSQRSMAELPEATAMPAGPVDYVTSGGRRYATVAWTAGDLVYVCGVEGGADAIEALQRTLDVPPA